MAEHTRESLIEKARELASRQDDPLIRDAFIELTGISRHFIEQLFSGWRELADLAGIPAHPSAHGRFRDKVLFAKFHSLLKEKNVKETKTIPFLREFAAYAGYSRGAIHRRFGGYPGFLKAFREDLMRNKPNSPYLELIPSESRHEEPGARRTSQAESAAPSPERKADRRRGIPLNRNDHDDIAHAMENLGKVFGCETLWKPKVNRLRPGKKSITSKDKTLDVAWEYGKQMWVPIEVQIAGSVSDLIYRFQQVHQWSHRLVVVSSPDSAAEIEEAVAEYPFRDKVIILAPDEVLAATKDLDRLLQLRTRIFES